MNGFSALEAGRAQRVAGRKLNSFRLKLNGVRSLAPFSCVTPFSVHLASGCKKNPDDNITDSAKGWAAGHAVWARFLIFAALSLGSATSVAAAPVNSESPSSPSNNGDESPAQFPTQFDKESDKGPIFQFYARKLPNLTYPSEPRDSKDDVDFCQDMGKDLQTLHGITFVEPIAKGKTIDDPAVRAYWPRCAKLEPDYVESPGGHIVPLYYWKGPVKLYRADYQNGMAADQEIRLNYAPGSEPLLLFSERLCARENTPLMPRCIGSLYDRVDPDQCMLDQYVIGGGDIYIDQNKYNLNAVMRYKGLVWLIGVANGFGQYQKYLKAAANGPVKPVHICLFSVDLQNVLK